MIQLTRRSALAGAAMTTMAAAGGFMTPEWARAATAPAAAQAPGFYRYKVGSIEITVITDGANRLPVTDEFVLNAKKEEVNAALAEAFMEPGVFVGPYNPIVINTGAKLALVDTGTGEAAYKASKGQTGQFLANLAAAGIRRMVGNTPWTAHNTPRAPTFTNRLRQRSTTWISPGQVPGPTKARAAHPRDCCVRSAAGSASAPPRVRLAWRGFPRRLDPLHRLRLRLR